MILLLNVIHFLVTVKKKILKSVYICRKINTGVSLLDHSVDLRLVPLLVAAAATAEASSAVQHLAVSCELRLSLLTVNVTR